MVDEANQGEWKGYLAEVARPLVERLGRTSRAGEPAKESELCLQLLFMLARDVDDAALSETAMSQAESYLSGQGSVDQALIEAYLYLAAKRGNVAIVALVKEALAEAKDPQRRSNLLAMLGQFEQPEAHALALDAMLDPVVTPSDLRTLLALNGDGEARRRRLRGWIEEHYPEISGKLPSAFLAHIVSSQSGLMDLQELERVKAFYSAQPDPNGAQMKLRLRADLRAALKERSADEAQLIRGLIAAIDNAEAPPLQFNERVGQHRFIDGTAEIERLCLAPAQVQAILIAEIQEREHAAVEMERLEKSDRADVLRAEALIAKRYVES